MSYGLSTGHSIGRSEDSPQKHIGIPFRKCQISLVKLLITTFLHL